MIGQDPRNCPYPQNPSAIQIKLSRRFLVYFSAVVVPLESQKVSQHAVVCRTVTEELYAFEMIASARACFITQRVIRARKGEGVRQERKNQEQCPQSHLRWTQASVQWLDASNCTAGLASRVAWQPLAAALACSTTSVFGRNQSSTVLSLSETTTKWRGAGRRCCAAWCSASPASTCLHLCRVRAAAVRPE